MSYHRMTRNQRHHRPYNAWLEDYRNHCEEIHGATFADYKMRVQEWHQENYPDCLTTPRLEGSQRGGR